MVGVTEVEIRRWARLSSADSGAIGRSQSFVDRFRSPSALVNRFLFLQGQRVGWVVAQGGAVVKLVPDCILLQTSATLLSDISESFSGMRLARCHSEDCSRLASDPARGGNS